MSQSLYTAMGGISAAQTSLNVISNNIANINTTAFKSSSTHFSDVFSTTISSGSVSTASTGGTNPIQVGVGVKVSAVTKDFSSGSWIATGSATDLMIQGPGFFTVTDGPSTFYTRAGDFSFDESGNLVTTNGNKVLGTDSIMSTATSKQTVTVPLSICANVEGNANIGSELVADLNGIDSNITEGEFVVRVSDGTDQVNVLINLSAADLAGTMNNLTGSLTTKVNQTVVSGGVTYIVGNIGVSATNGKIEFDMSAATLKVGAAAAGPVTEMEFSTPATAIVPGDGISNFVTLTSLRGSTPIAGSYSSKIMDSTVSVSQLSSANQSITKTSQTINSDGSIQVTYQDGSTLSVQLGTDKSTYEFMYTTAGNTKITGNKCMVDTNVAEPANFAIQLATITNTDGLISVGNNAFRAGPNSGDVVYTVAGQMGAGKMESGGLEASNVDLSQEFSNMILAQRAVQANSRVFSTTSTIMDTIVNMGR